MRELWGEKCIISIIEINIIRDPHKNFLCYRKLYYLLLNVHKKYFKMHGILKTLKTLNTFNATVCQYNTIQCNVICLQNVYKVNSYF